LSWKFRMFKVTLCLNIPNNHFRAGNVGTIPDNVPVNGCALGFVAA